MRLTAKLISSPKTSFTVIPLGRGSAMVLFVGLILNLLIARAHAAEVLDPWSDLRPAHAVRCLASLRTALDAKPDDQTLLGRAIGAYVTLSFNGHPEVDGAFGPWLNYARVLVDRRRVARGGAKPVSLEAAAPELWVQLLDGDAKGVVAALDSLPANPASLHGVALRALATTDWRLLNAVPRRSALTDYASMVLFHRTRAMMVGMSAESLTLIDPYVVHRSVWELNYQIEDATCLAGEAVAGIALLLRGRQIDDATALSEARELLTALDATSDPAAGRDRVLADLQRSAQAMAYDNAKAFAVAERIALAHCDGEQGIRGADGRHLLIGIGDVAQWVRSRLCDAAYFSYIGVWKRLPGYPSEENFAAHDQAFGAVLRTTLPEAVLTTAVGIGLTDPGFYNLDEPSPKTATEALSKAILTERARAHPLPDRQLITVIARLAKRRADLAAPIVADVLAHWQISNGVHARSGLNHLLKAAWYCDIAMPDVTRSAATRSPADADLRSYAMNFDPQVRQFDWTDHAPTSLWNAALIDTPKDRPLLQRHGDGEYAISWDGWLKIETPGAYQFQLVSDGYFKAAIGERVLADRRSTTLFPESAARTTTTYEALAAGWISLWLDYEFRGENSECRLLWKPPGAKDFTAVPPQFFAHGPDHAAGLSARALEARQERTAFEQLTGVNATTFAWAATIPWRSDIQMYLNNYATSHRQFRPLLPVLLAGQKAGARIGQSPIINCLFMSSGADIDEGLRLLRNQEFLSQGFSENRLLVSHLRDEKRLPAFIESQKEFLSQPENSYLHMLVTLSTGGFTAAQPLLADGIGDASLWIVKSDLRPLCLLAHASHRLCGKPPPDFKRLEEQAGEPKDAGYLAALGALDGVNDPQTVTTLSPGDQDLVLWATALLDASEGEHARAQARLTAITANPQADPAIVDLSRDLLVWYASQTPKTLAAMPKATPVKRRTTGNVKLGADDF